MKVDWEDWEFEMRRLKYLERCYPTLHSILGENWRVYYKMFFSWVEVKSDDWDDADYYGTLSLHKSQKNKFLFWLRFIEKEL